MTTITEVEELKIIINIIEKDSWILQDLIDMKLEINTLLRKTENFNEGLMAFYRLKDVAYGIFNSDNKGSDFFYGRKELLDIQKNISEEFLLTNEKDQRVNIDAFLGLGWSNNSSVVEKLTKMHDCMMEFYDAKKNEIDWLLKALRVPEHFHIHRGYYGVDVLDFKEQRVYIKHYGIENFNISSGFLETKHILELKGSHFEYILKKQYPELYI
jgi:hypothetical protein